MWAGPIRWVIRWHPSFHNSDHFTPPHTHIHTHCVICYCECATITVLSKISLLYPNNERDGWLSAKTIQCLADNVFSWARGGAVQESTFSMPRKWEHYRNEKTFGRIIQIRLSVETHNVFLKIANDLLLHINCSLNDQVSENTNVYLSPWVACGAERN